MSGLSTKTKSDWFLKQYKLQTDMGLTLKRSFVLQISINLLKNNAFQQIKGRF